MVDEAFHQQTTIPDLSLEEKKTIEIPEMIGPYKIESLLNRGGMSILYLGSHPNVKLPLAVKVLSPKYLKNKEIVSRFLKESQIIRMADHPNIVKLYGQGKWEKGLYIAMEFIQGISLRQFILQKSLSQKRALDIILQVAYALCHLHTHGIIHRDLKPENILITESGKIKVIDFGIAQLADEFEKELSFRNKKLMGTPTYMSPEQKENPDKLSYSSDIFSLGIILYELILGKLSYGVIQLSILPLGLRKIVDRSLKINPAERYQDIVDFITDISQYIQNIGDEKKKEELVSTEEFIDRVIEVHRSMLPQSPPNWTQAKIGFFQEKGMALTGIYYDFFMLSENRCIFVLVEPLHTGIETVFYTSYIRGMIRSLVDHYFMNGVQDQHPVPFLNHLNRLVCMDPFNQQFRLSFLMLSPHKDQLSYISCTKNDLWHFPSGQMQPRILSTPNPALGQKAQESFLETADNWYPEDRLYLFSTELLSKVKTNELTQIIMNHQETEPKTQVKKIMHEILPTISISMKRSSFILCIQRI